MENSKKRAKNIIRDNYDVIIKAFKETPIKEIYSLIRGVNLGFKLCTLVLRETLRDRDVGLNDIDSMERKEYNEIINMIKNIKRGGGEA